MTQVLCWAGFHRRSARIPSKLDVTGRRVLWHCARCRRPFWSSELAMEDPMWNQLSVVRLLALAAFLCIIGTAMGRVPIWVAVLLLTIVALMGVLPLR